jgi:excisionase family DNA binding protein
VAEPVRTPDGEPARSGEHQPRVPRWLTPDEAAAYAGVSTSLIYKWCSEGRLAHYRPGATGKRGRILIDPADLDQVIREYRRERHPLLAYGEPSPPPP